ncbi:hypothetical protein ACHQM5_009135 [Ranunculus cassubicifolius]
MVLSSLIPLLLFFTLTDLTISTNDNNNNYYLKLPLLHRNPSSTSPSKTLFTDSTRLSTLFSTLNPQKTLKSPLVSGAPSGSGQYFVDFSIGTPPQKLLLVADTGSDLVWVKCSACRNCSTHQPGSAFFVRHSSTFIPFHCYDKACLNFPHSPKIGRVCNKTRLHSTCRYDYTYGDESRTSGFFSRETTRLNTSSGKEAKLSNLAFGCGFEVSGPSITGASFNGANGVMGLGRGSISFSTQLGQRFGNKFSYCLMDYTLSPPPTSFLMIGKNHESEPVSKPIKSRPVSRPISKPKLSFTPFQNNPTTNSTFYYIGINSVVINGVSLRIDPSVWLFDEEGNGGTVIDSGTTLSFFAEPAYRHILTAVKRRVRFPVIDDPDQTFELCVNVSGSANPSLPRLSFKLTGNSVFSPPSANYFIDTADGVKCLAIQPVTSQTGFSVLGNLMQQGFLFEFDREKSRLGFTRHGCSIP